MNIGATLTLPIGSGAAGCGTRIWLAAGVTDMRKGFDGLAALVQRRLSENAFSGHILVFRGQRWVALTRFIDDGRVEIDNNAAERALRSVAQGRRDYLFAGSDAGGARAAAIYSLIGTAKLNGLDPEAYLRYVITHINEHRINKIADLLPWNVAAKLPRLTQETTESSALAA